jgi:hypothetical protein
MAVPRMAEILQFIRPDNSFDPETIALLGAAYDKAVAELSDHEQPKLVREMLAKRIIALAMKGERNPERLCKSALAAVGQTK